MCFILLSFNKFKGNNGLDKFESKYWFNGLSEWYFDWKAYWCLKKTCVLLGYVLKNACVALGYTLDKFESKNKFDVLSDL